MGCNCIVSSILNSVVKTENSSHRRGAEDAEKHNFLFSAAEGSELK
jgi:hypothetical protein